MPNREQLRGHWNEVKGRLKEHWAQLTEDDLRRAEGSADRLVGVVQQKTGATRSEIERFLDSLFNSGMRDQATETVQQYSDAAQKMAAEASQFARDQAQRLASQSSDYSARVVERARTRPGETLAIAFGLGLAAGAFLFLGRKK
ncbi:CsbD family protein [Novipirellula caenicola]|uniref:CsbD-like domain-containing protein n=1 Tax=Novipirellula caenicola TaxID=1536901 RepID=A0ABP9VKY2_9BACT